MAYPNNVARAVFEFTLPNGSPGYVTPHFMNQDGADFTAGDVEALALSLEDWAVNADYGGQTNTDLMTIATDQCTLSSITVTSLDATAPPQFVQSVGVAGSQTGTPLPNESALVVTLYTGIVGRSYRGRNFWPVLATAYMEDNGTIATATLATIQQTFNALRLGLDNIGNHELVVHSTTLGTATPVNSVVARDTVHHQRRRNN